MPWKQRFLKNPQVIRAKMWLQKQIWKLQQSGKFIIFIMFYSLFLDNMLLTVIVPIVPEYLKDIDDDDVRTANASSIFVDDKSLEQRGNYSIECHSTDPEICRLKTLYKTAVDFRKENEEVGLLLSSKALVQLIANPIAGTLTNRIGCRTPLFIGCLILLACSLTFAFGQTYLWLLAARSVQGLGSACIAISGMAMIADRYLDDKERSRNMGITLGGTALGVLVGYPFGGLMYDFFGKTVPLMVISGLILFDVVVQLVVLKPGLESERLLIGVSMVKLMSDPYILLSTGAIFVSTCVMSTLEPCLPIWLMEEMSPSKWQLGIVFIPDSLGYLLGTTLFGSLAFRTGRWLSAMISLMIVGLGAIMIPFSTHILELFVPHFSVGLGIGIIDASVMPLLAYLVETRYVTLYGSVYAIAQFAVSLAYCFGPLVGGQLARVVGFPWLMRGIGIVNMLYCPLCYFLKNPPSREEGKALNADKIVGHEMCNRTPYSTFNNDE